MLCVDFCNTLYKLEINRTFIEHMKKICNKKVKKIYIYQHAKRKENRPVRL